MSEIKLYANNTCSYQIRKIKIPIKDLKRYEGFLSRQIIQEPTDELLAIYEKRVLHEMSGLRAEKFDSPEHKEELKKIQQELDDQNKIPRNIQNPNYDKLMNHYKLIVSSSSLTGTIDHIQDLIGFLNQFEFWLGGSRFDYQPGILSRFLDCRCFQEEPEMYFHYLLTKMKHIFQKKEYKKFKELINNQFDDESIEESIHYLKGARDNKDDYIDLVYQILEALPQKYLKSMIVKKNQNSESKSNKETTIEYEIPLENVKMELDKTENLKQFFDYLFYSDT